MVTLNPMITTNDQGSFGISSIGFVAGSLYPNAAARNFIRGGTIAQGQNGLFYGGVGISAALPAGGNNSVGSNEGAVLSLATGEANLSGFAVWEQSASGIMTPQSTVPLFSPGMGLNFIEFGMGNCIALPISAANAAALLGQSDSTQLSWDFTNQVVIPYTAAGANAGSIPGDAPGGVARIISVNVGNSEIVVPNSPSAGMATWNGAGSVVVLQV